MTIDPIKRLEEGSGADRELDLVIGELWPEPRPFDLTINQQRGGKPTVYHFTISLDACIALAEKVLPGFYVGIDGTQSWLVTIYHGGHEGTGEHKNFPRAFLLALLKTKGREKP